MEIKANLNYLRISPRKVRLVTDLIKGMDVQEAEIQLKFLTKKAAKPVLKLLKSAIANAEHNFGINKDNLYISEIQVNEGPRFKRWMPRAMGRADLILKRTSHVKLVLGTKKEVEVKKKKSKPKVIKTEELEKDKEIEKQLIQEKETETKEGIKEKTKAPSKEETPKGKLLTEVKGLSKKIFRRKAF